MDAPATRTRVLATEALLLDRAGVLARFREVLAAAPGEIADMVERLTAIIPDVQCMGPAIEVRCGGHTLEQAAAMCNGKGVMGESTAPFACAYA